MNTRRVTYWFVILLALALIVPTYLTAISHRAFATPSNYYVDNQHGSDSNLGTSPDTAWASVARVNGGPCAYPGNPCGYNPGDKILFEDGETWQDTGTNLAFLHPLGNGTGTPIGGVITISHYCNATYFAPCTAQPAAELDGQGDQATIYLVDQSYWEINHLTITNKPSGCVPPNCTNAFRYGVYVFDDSKTATTYHHIYVTNLTVHDVVGYDSIHIKNDDLLGKVTGGIIVETENLTGHPNANVGNAQSSFDDIHISNNIVHDVWLSGIFLHSDWQGPVKDPIHPPDVYPCSQFSGTWVPSTNVVADSNTVYNIGGTGIDVQVSTGQIFSNNTVHDGQLAHWASEGIASLDSYAPVYKNNIVYSMKYNGADTDPQQTDHGPDAAAFDIDDCDYGAIVEYNWSHDNQGAFITVPQDSQHAIIRYNISERDGYGSSADPGNFMINAKGNYTGDGMQVYNNDIYMDDTNHSGPGTGLLQNYLNGSQQIAPLFENNLVDNEQTDQDTSCSSDKFVPNQQGYINWTVNYNGFYDGNKQGGVCPKTPQQQTPVPANAYFTSPGNGYGHSLQDVIADYTLLTSSHATCTGTIVVTNPTNGGYDFQGVSLSNFLIHVDDGALQLSTSCNP